MISLLETETSISLADCILLSKLIGFDGASIGFDGIRSINGRYKIERGRLRIVQETEKPKNLHVQPMDMN